MSTEHQLHCESCDGRFATIVESGLTIDYCVSCSLVWFDKNELEQYCYNNSIKLAAAVFDDEVSFRQSCPKCESELATARHGRERFGACLSCGGYLVSSKSLDRKLPKKERTRPLQQLDGPVSVLEFLGLFFPFC